MRSSLHPTIHELCPIRSFFNWCYLFFSIPKPYKCIYDPIWLLYFSTGKHIKEKHQKVINNSAFFWRGWWRERQKYDDSLGDQKAKTYSIKILEIDRLRSVFLRLREAHGKFEVQPFCLRSGDGPNRGKNKMQQAKFGKKWAGWLVRVRFWAGVGGFCWPVSVVNDFGWS